jgi:hypothetical protein
MDNPFKNCTSQEERRKIYRELSKVHHPDRGGNTETMQQINAWYTYQETGFNFETREAKEDFWKSEGQYMDIINALLNIEKPGLIIEICGAWIWVSGPGTYANRAEIKAAGLFFASKKLAWYWRSAEHKSKNKKSISLEDIRHKYGSHIISGGYQFKKQLA